MNILQKYPLLSALLLSLSLQGQPFQKNGLVSGSIISLSGSSVCWLDFDSDGDFDIITAGIAEGIPYLNLYQNNEGTFNKMETGLPQLFNCYVSTGDADNDNDPDLLITGTSISDGDTVPVTLLYINEQGVFTQSNQIFEGVFSGKTQWADLDNDGLNDIILTGKAANGGLTRIYQNKGNLQFQNVNTSFVDIFDGDVAVCDYDNDMDNDILLAGFFTNAQGNAIRTLKVYRNEGSFVFTSITGPFTGMGNCNVKWFDYNNDGMPDIIANGSTDAPTYLVYIYENQGDDIFNNIGIEIFGTVNGSLSPCDYDNDGDTDFLLTGFSSFDQKPESVAYKNAGNGLFNKDYNVILPPVMNSDAAWCDYDNDGDCDILLSGQTATKNLTAVFDNMNPFVNNPPAVPGGLQVILDGNTATFTWEPAYDIETPSPGLTYNIKLGTEPFTGNIVSPLSLGEGNRIIISQGNANHNIFAKIAGLSDNTYYFSVQAIDNCFAASEFSGQLQFTIENTSNETVSVPPVNVFPNPFSEFVSIDIVEHNTGNVTCKILDNKGIIVRSIYLTAKTGVNTIIWNGKSSNGKEVPYGIYNLIVQFQNKTFTTKIIKME